MIKCGKCGIRLIAIKAMDKYPPSGEYGKRFLEWEKLVEEGKAVFVSDNVPSICPVCGGKVVEEH